MVETSQPQDSAPMQFYEDERIGLFIDGNNLFTTSRALGFDIDYRRLFSLFASRGRLMRAFYYTAIIEHQDYTPIRPLIDWLDYNGFTVVRKMAKEFIDPLGRRKVKNNMNVDIAVDMLTMSQHLNHAVLFSGDGDLQRLVECVQRKGVRVSVVSTAMSEPPMVADELRRHADQFIDLGDLKEDISRDGETTHAHHRQPVAAESGGGRIGALPRRYTATLRRGDE